ncbi:MAG: nitrile hydratase subunit beta [Rubrobacteraceae bacterium]|nr:nitrile hydratase subunit beta [Rubrobacteraceae bacterium]
MAWVHDMGGLPDGPVDRSQHDVEDWERLADAINSALGAKGIQSTDQLRRAIESLENYRDLSYYERWVAATEKLLVEKSILTSVEIDERTAEVERRWGAS